MSDAPVPGYATDPSPVLVEVFSTIQRERMHDVPILNPSLSVEAVGFEEYQGNWIGVLVTPWFMNLVALPGSGAWRSAPERASVYYAFPTGIYEFIAGVEPGIGEYHACSLFSPMPEFADQVAARETARAARAALFDPRLLGEGREPAPPEAEPPTLSRRELLRGGRPPEP
jgi:[NiFe] hydrogenase assembly HybE family chaperone